jgi:hypothetical protein
MNDQCIGIDSDNYIDLQDCDNSLSQKWFPYKDNYISYSGLKCLTAEECTIDKDQQITNDSGSVIDTNQTPSMDSWETQNGKNVVLIEPETPWYIL